MASFLQSLFGSKSVEAGWLADPWKDWRTEPPPVRTGPQPAEWKDYISEPPKARGPALQWKDYLGEPPAVRGPAAFLETLFPKVLELEPVIEPPQVLVQPEIVQPKAENFLETSQVRPATEPAPIDELSGFSAKDRHWLESGEWIHVFSSNVSALRYGWPQENLQVEYLDGSVYQYYRVPPKEAVDFTYALSPGRFRWQVMGDPRWNTVHYDYKRLRAGRKGRRPKARVARELPPRGRKALL